MESSEVHRYHNQTFRKEDRGVMRECGVFQSKSVPKLSRMEIHRYHMAVESTDELQSV